MLELVDHSNGSRAGTSWYYAPYRNSWMSSDWTTIGSPSDLVYYDPMLDLIRTFEFRSPRFSYKDCAGSPDPVLEPSTSNVFGYKPNLSDLPAKLNKLHTLSDVIRFLSGSTTPVDLEEHDIAHINLVGRVHVGVVDSSVPGNNSVFQTTVTFDDTHSSYAFSGGVLPGTSLPVNTHLFLNDVIEQVNAGLFDLNVNPDVTIRVKDLSFGLTDGVLSRISYTLMHGAYGLPGDGITDWLWYKEIVVGYGVEWEMSNSPLTTSYLIRSRILPKLYKVAHCTKHYARASGSQPVWHLSPVSLGSVPSLWPEAQYFDGNQAWNVTSTPGNGWISYSGVSGIGGYSKVDTGATSFVRFRREVSVIQNDLLVMGFQAQGAAWDDNIVTLKTNVLEFLSEVAQIADLIKNPVEFFTQLATVADALHKGKPSVSIARLFLDACTDAQLFYSFMLRPNVKFAAEVAANAKRLLRSFDSFYGWQDIKGRAVYFVGDEIPFFAGSPVVGRSKMRVRIPPDSVLAAVLPYEKLGVLPSLSRYWATLRLSFVLDWFFNVQSKLDVIDKTMRYMALDVAYVTNSVSLYDPITPTDFVVEDETSYKYYARWVLPAAQVFTPTRLAVLGGSGPISWLTAGSLFYKLGS